MDLCARVESNIEKHSLASGTDMLVAVSGGVDSMVLFHVLRAMGGTQGWKIAAAHLNHGLRGTESDADEAFVRDTSARWNLPCFAASGDVQGRARARGISIEMAGRELRHRFLIETAEKNGFGTVALAHHADDQMETFWMRLLRGDVGPGLAGMRWKRPARDGSKVRFIRPLLDIPKAELVAYAESHRIDYRVDRSNSDRAFLRNRMRIEVLPHLEKYQSALREITLRQAEVSGTEKDFLESEGRRWLESRDRVFSDLHVALQRETIRLQLLSLGVRPNFEWIEALRDSAERPISVGKDERLVRTASGEVRRAELPKLHFSTEERAVELAGAGTFAFGGIEFEYQFVPSREESVPGTEYFDASSVGGKIQIRRWAAGDWFKPIGLGGRKKIQDLFTNMKIGAEEKRQRVVACDARGNVFWVEGLRIGEDFKVSHTTRRVLRWKWRRIAPA